MTYPYLELVPLLQTHASPDEYLHSTPMWKPGQRRGKAYTADYANYWPILPTYVYAHCPFCGQEDREPIDTYTMEPWGSHDNLTSRLYLPNEYPVPRRVQHFIAIHNFINL